MDNFCKFLVDAISGRFIYECTMQVIFGAADEELVDQIFTVHWGLDKGLPIEEYLLIAFLLLLLLLLAHNLNNHKHIIKRIHLQPPFDLDTLHILLKKVYSGKPNNPPV